MRTSVRASLGLFRTGRAGWSDPRGPARGVRSEWRLVPCSSSSRAPSLRVA